MGTLTLLSVCLSVCLCVCVRARDSFVEEVSLVFKEQLSSEKRRECSVRRVESVRYGAVRGGREGEDGEAKVAEEDGKVLQEEGQKDVREEEEKWGARQFKFKRGRK